MSKGNILFIDNDEPFLETRAEFLERADYKVFPATSLTIAEELLDQHFIHLIITDVRAINDDDIHDKSGIEFARRPEYAPIPKIILTGEPSVKDSRKVLAASSTSNFIVTAQEYLEKDDDVEDMVRIVDEIFARNVLINHDLEIDWKNISCIELLGIIEPELGVDEIGARLTEFEALFRTLFNQFESVTIGQLLTGIKRYPKLLAYAVNQNGSVKKFFVEVGKAADIKDALAHYERAVAHNQFESGLYTTEKSLQSTTTRYGAVGWTFRGNSPSQYYVTFKNMMRNRELDEIRQTLQALFAEPLNLWHGHLSVTETIGLNQLFGESEEPERFIADPLTTTARVIAGQASRISIHDLDVNPNGAIDLKFEDCDESYLRKLDDLVDAVTNQSERVELKKGVIHNNLNIDSIYFDHSGKAWLTSFEKARLSDFCLIDSVRFAQNLRKFWSSHTAPRSWWQIEQAVLNSEARPEIHNPFWQKIVIVLEEVQKFACEADGLTQKQFLEALFWANVSDLHQLSPDQLRGCDEVQRAINLVSSTLQIGRFLVDDDPAPTFSFEIDYDNQAARVGAETVELTPQEFKLICYLATQANKAVSRKDITVQAFDDPYDISNKSYMDNRVNMIVSRLREKVDDFTDFELISTVRGKGYRLNLPEDVDLRVGS